MARGLKFLNISVLGFCALLFLCCNFCFACVFENGHRKYNLTALDWPEWKWQAAGWQAAGTKNGSNVVMYDISLCRPLNYSTSPAKETCANSSVCRHSGGIATDMAQFTPNLNTSVHDGVLKGGFMLLLTAARCPANTATQYHTIINFVCGQTLGSPEVFMESECRVHMLWKTSAACKDQPKHHGVPCYVIDKEGNKITLEALSFLAPFPVLSPYRNHNTSIMVGVCNTAYPDCKDCPPEVAADRITEGGPQPVGRLSSGLELTEEGLRLTYGPPNPDQPPPDGCPLQPTTTLLFRCPERLKGRYPQLISDIDCQYEIEWETEHACPQSILKGDFKTCKFTDKVHGVDLDLSPLRRDKDFYEVNGTLPGGKDPAVFVFNVCGGLGNDYMCNGTTWASNAVCMKYSNASETIAVTSPASLMLVERRLSLKYEGPQCHGHPGKAQMTEIIFSCYPNATNDGNGYPVQMDSDECRNSFYWETKYACLTDKPVIQCSVREGDKFFDLNRLRKTSGRMWNVLSPRGRNRDSNPLYFMNVCGPIFGPMTDNIPKCEGDPAVSRIEDDKCINLGEFTSPPFYYSTTQSVRMEYSNGSICRGNTRWSSVVEFKCYPGLFTSDVILTHVNEAGCVNEFEFRSAIACPLTNIVGKECRLVDPQAGVNIDLSPLNSSVHEVTGPQHKFYLSICNSLPRNNSCLKLLNSSQDVAACAVSLNKSDSKAENLGAPSSEVSYIYGNVNLKYASGPSSDKNQTRMNILFMCNIHAGSGTPVFSRVVENTYIFHWYTSLVCPQPATTDCVVSDPKTGRQYDFRGLSKSTDNWVAYFDEHEENRIVKRKLYLNMCRSLNPAPSCDSDAAACIVTIEGEKETKYLSNVGRATSIPELSSDDHLQLHYTHGKSCTAYGQNINYSIIVHFVCSYQDINKLRFLGKLGECQYMFLWNTRAACPSEVISVENECVLTDPETGFTFDLTSLIDVKNAYEVSAGNLTYKLNICSKVRSGCTSDNSTSDSNITVCEVSGEDGQIAVLGTTTNFTLQYVKGRNLTLTYKNIAGDSKKDQSSEVAITFPCDDAASKAQPKFIMKSNQKYLFEFRTPLSCIHKVSDCTIYDHQGNEYDLTVLYQSTENWVVPDPRRTHRGISYFINFCRPLVKVPGYICPSGATGACQTNATSLRGVSLGSQLDIPTVAEHAALAFHYSGSATLHLPGTITVYFSGGDECREGQRRSAYVSLFCSGTQGEIEFVDETPDCEFIFSMHTPAACSSQPAVGENCYVRDPLFGHSFNLNSLKNKRLNFSAVDGEYEYFIGVCEKLDGFSGACENSSVCQTKPNDPKFSKSLGLPSSELIYSEGIITLSYDFGSVCHDTYNRSAVIKFTCKHPTDVFEEEKPYFISEAENCTYLFEWPTKLACPPYQVTECATVDDQGLLYDLSDLSLPDDNYYVRNPISPSQTFVINVCRSVVHSPDSLCPYASAACLLDPANTLNSRVNIGQVTRPPYIENGKLLIKYATGDPCESESAHFMETVIEFICDKQKISSTPEFIGQDICTYYFTWSTAFACSVNEQEISDDCHATDPLTGFEFDLSPLKKDDPYVIQTADHNYFLNVCGDVKTSPCGGTSGVCQQELQGKRTWNAGNANSRLVYHAGFLTLHYSDGAPCHQNTYHRSSIIQFECSAVPRNPKLLFEASNCTYYFVWRTPLACQSLVHCAVRNGSNLFDLTPLTVYPYHTAVSDLDNDSAEYYISVCNSLNRVPGLSCPVGSSVCRSGGGNSAPVSLGRVSHPPFVDFEGHATIIYTNGSTCLSNTKQQYKSRIIFKCDPVEYMGSPVLVQRDDHLCLHVFEWRTNLICPLEPVDIPQDVSGCIFSDNSTGIHFDLSGLKKTGSHYEVVGDNGDLFLLNICGEVAENGCSKSAVCLQNSDKLMNSFGTASSQKFSYDGSRLRATFTDGDDCPSSASGKRSAEIFFVCDPKIGLGKPKLYKKYSCLTVFMWETSLVCKDINHPCSFHIGEKYFDIHLLSSLSHNWNTTDSENNVYFLNPCRGLYNKDAETKDCPSSAAVCMKQDNSVMSLGLVHTMNKSLSDSGELVLTYTSGSTRPCSSVESRVQPLTANSKITMKCGTSWGSPKIVSGPDSSCTYSFDWITSLACDVKNEDLIFENNDTLIDKRLGFEMDLAEIFNKTFKVLGNSEGDIYTYVVNIGQGYKDAVGDDDHRCSVAAVCQTKPETHFYRDIGSISSEKFSLRGSELHLSLISHTKGCGKNKERNVTTVFTMKCTSYAGDGIPEFMYESSGCDYIFSWDTNAVCPIVHRRVLPVTESPPPASEDISSEGHVFTSSSNVPAAIIAVLCIVLILCPVVYIVSKKERRSAAATKIRSIFHHVTLPHFRYRRADGESLILINGSQVSQSGYLKDDDLLS